MTNFSVQERLNPSALAEAPSSETSLRDKSVERRKKVFLVQTQAENAGAQELARQLAHGAEREGWRAKLVFFFRRTDSFDAEDNVLFCAPRRPTSPLGVLRLLIGLYMEFRRETPDAVISYQHYGNLIAAPIARLAGVPHVIANQVSATENIPSWARVADLWLGRLGFYDRIVVNSSTTEAFYGKYPQSYTKRIVRIDHGFFDKSIAMSRQDARRVLALPQDAELLGCAARLHPLKQLDLAIRLLAVHGTQHLALAGQGADRPRLEALARELGVSERVHFLGELDTQAMGVLLAAIDCFVFPSAAETFGLAPIEAAQAGVPVVANDLDVLKCGLAIDGAPCALFVDARDTAAFAAATRRVFDDKALAAELSARGRRLKQRFPLDKMVGEFMQLLQPADRKTCA